MAHFNRDPARTAAALEVVHKTTRKFAVVQRIHVLIRSLSNE